jgi:predicted RecB family nuclease
LRSDQWVSKTDLTSFLRCPYAWWQIDQGLISVGEIIGPLDERLIEDGNVFHQEVEAMASPIPGDADLAEMLTTDVKLLGLPILENESRMIFGAPDGVDAASGALFPVEIKSHKDVRRSDELELAFYWLLLEPHRTRQVNEPRGWLVLRRDDEAEQVEVPIQPRRFEQVERMLKEIRKARNKGVKPRVCSCAACSGPLRKSINRQTRRGKDLTLLFDISRSRAAALEAAGVKDYEGLIALEPRELRQTLRESKTFVSAQQIEQMRWHARSYKEVRPILFGPMPIVGDAFIALDLEYNTLGKPDLIWLIGLLLVRGGHREHIALWASSPDEERGILERLAALLDQNQELPVLTWSGVSADLPALRKACARVGLESLVERVKDRHVDLFESARTSLRLPIPQLGLAEVAAFLGIPKLSTVDGGFEAQLMFKSYEMSKKPEQKEKLKAELIAYNRDDLEALIETLGFIQALPAEPGVRTSRVFALDAPPPA